MIISMRIKYYYINKHKAKGVESRTHGWTRNRKEIKSEGMWQLYLQAIGCVGSFDETGGGCHGGSHIKSYTCWHSGRGGCAAASAADAGAVIPLAVHKNHNFTSHINTHKGDRALCPNPWAGNTGSVVLWAHYIHSDWGPIPLVHNTCSPISMFYNWLISAVCVCFLRSTVQYSETSLKRFKKVVWSGPNWKRAWQGWPKYKVAHTVVTDHKLASIHSPKTNSYDNMLCEDIGELS